MKKTILTALTKQMNMEFDAGYLYLSMASYFEDQGLGGFAHWMKLQAEEEKGHAMKIFEYLVERGQKAELMKISAPKNKWNSPLSAFKDAYNHEVKVSESIGRILEKARDEKDHATEVFLHWFVEEQVEEEASAMEIIDKLKFVGDSTSGILQLDRAMASRK